MNKYILMLIILLSSTHARDIELSANVISDNEKIISSRFMAYIKDVYVREGKNVKKGDLLYEIDSFEIKSKKEKIENTLKIQNNNLLNIKINYQRYQRLYEKDLVAKYELEQKELAYKNSLSMIKISKSSLKEINEQYKYLRVRSPIDGLITKRFVSQGELSIPGKKAFIISDLSSLKIISNVSNNDLKYIYLNQEVEIEIDSNNFKTSGKIISITPNLSLQTHSFKIKIDFNYPSNIYPGMYAKIYIKSKNNE